MKCLISVTVNSFDQFFALKKKKANLSILLKRKLAIKKF